MYEELTVASYVDLNDPMAKRSMSVFAESILFSPGGCLFVDLLGSFLVCYGTAVT